MPNLRPLKAGSGARIFMLVFGLFWTVVCIMWVAGAWMAGAPTLMMLFGLPFIGIGLWVMVWAALPILARLKVASPEVSVSNDRLSPGEAFSFRFEQGINASAQVQGVKIALVFRESATYRQGTTTTTATHDHVIAKAEFPGEQMNSGTTLLHQIRFTIPADAMHTFTASKNTLQWLITVHVSIAGWPDFNEAYPVQVLPMNAAPAPDG